MLQHDPDIDGDLRRAAIEYMMRHGLKNISITIDARLDPEKVKIEISTTRSI